MWAVHPEAGVSLESSTKCQNCPSRCTRAHRQARFRRPRDGRPVTWNVASKILSIQIPIIGEDAGFNAHLS